MAYRDNFIPGDGPFYTPGAVALSALSTARGGTFGTTVTFTNLPPGEAPLLPSASTLGIEVTADVGWGASWSNATAAVVAGNSVHVESDLPGAVVQVRYLWSDNACVGWNSSTSTRETNGLQCPLYTRAGLPVLPFIINISQKVA
jgi:hypothetical protein